MVSERVVARVLRHGVALSLVLFFAASMARAEQINPTERLISPDGSLVPDFERNRIADDNPDLYDDALQRRVRPRPEPQDPLNKLYENSSSAVLDRLDREQGADFSAGRWRDPLLQVPRDFRDDSFVQDLVRQARRRDTAEGGGDVAGGAQWQSRDDTAFAPLGMTLGSFVFYPELYSRLVGSNNMFANDDNRQADQAVELTPTFRLRSDWNNHELELFGTLTQRRWQRFSSENTTEYELRMRGRVDVTSRTGLEAGFRHEQNMEGRGSIELPDSAVSPALVREEEIFGQIDHRFNRLGFRLRGQVVRNLHENVMLNNGNLQNNKLRDYDEQVLTLRTSYEFSPRLSMFFDLGGGRRVFQNKLDDNGLLQGSKSRLISAGMAIEMTSSLSLIASMGYAKVRPDETSLTDLQGIIYDASLVWTPTRLFTASLKGQGEIEETGQSNSPGSINRSLALELNNSWTHRLSSTLKAEYEEKDYAGISRTDSEMTVGLGVEYLFSRSWVLDTGYEYKMADADSDYREGRFHIGLKWRR